MRGLIFALCVAASPAGACDNAFGVSAPFWGSRDLDTAHFGGYGVRYERRCGSTYASADILRKVRRANHGEVATQVFLSGGYRLNLRKGVAVVAGIALNPVSDVLSAPLSFNLGADYCFKRVCVGWRHWSNANLAQRNHAFDTLTITFN